MALTAAASSSAFAGDESFTCPAPASKYNVLSRHSAFCINNLENCKI